MRDECVRGLREAPHGTPDLGGWMPHLSLFGLWRVAGNHPLPTKRRQIDGHERLDRAKILSQDGPVEWCVVTVVDH